MAFCVSARLPATSTIESATGEVGSAGLEGLWARAPRAPKPAAPATPPTKPRRVIFRSVMSFLPFWRDCPPRSLSKLVGLFRQAIGEVVRKLMRLILIQAMLDDKLREIRAIDPAGDVVAGRNRGKGARVVVEADGVVEARRLGRELAKAPHALGAVEE